MTPKEKAKEFIERFTFICKECDYDWNAKQCALIAVDEILEEILPLDYHPFGSYCNPKIEYWKQVKSILEKL